jgi:hypothetical protein
MMDRRRIISCSNGLNYLNALNGLNRLGRLGNCIRNLNPALFIPFSSDE